MNDPIKAKIVELCPDIMELKFGCEVKEHASTGDEQIYRILQKHGNFYQTQAKFREDCGVATFGENAGFRVLGSSITLSVVLRAIGIDDKTTGTMDKWRESAAMALDILARWNLTKDNYDDQTEETKKFIGSLLGV